MSAAADSSALDTRDTHSRDQAVAARNTTAPDIRTPVPRLISLDQFRGYTVLGMFLVNFVGSFTAVKTTLPLLSHHHTYCSYADTIMPQFFFAVGFAYRLTYLRRRETHSTGEAIRHAIRRNLSLFLVAVVVYSVGSRWEKWDAVEQLWPVIVRWAKQDVMQTLGHIAVTSLWVLPVIGARPSVRVVYLLASGVLHLGLSYWFNYRWANTPPNGVDGGPLGFLTWTIPLLIGSLAYDAWKAAHTNRITHQGLLVRLFGWGAVVMAAGYGLSCLHLAPLDLDQGRFDLTVAYTPPPLVHVEAKPPTNDLFTMSQRSGSVTYPLFVAGWSLMIYGLCVVLCDRAGWQWGLLRTFGTNALAGYIIHGLVAEAVKPFVPRDAPLWYVFAGFSVYFAICYACLRGLELQKLYLKL